jgi:hypothetical protein
VAAHCTRALALASWAEVYLAADLACHCGTYSGHDIPSLKEIHVLLSLRAWDSAKPDHLQELCLDPTVGDCALRSVTVAPPSDE